MVHRASVVLAACFFTVTLGLAACGDDSAGGKKDAQDATDATSPSDADTRDGTVAPDTFITEDTAVPVDTVEPVDTQPEEVTPGGFGAPCNSNGDCESGYCVDGPKGYVCTRTCDTTCPSGYDCKSIITSGSDVVFLCLPRVKLNCTPCAQDFQCPGGLCLELDGESRCAYPCVEDSECPTGFGCDEVDREGIEVKFCQPTTGSCSCYAEANGGQRSCTTDNDIGSCQGVSECDPDVGWSACSAAEAVPEVCNGKDDDCDGIWDNDLAGVGASCSNVVEGVGSCPGVQLCLGQAGWYCQGPMPAPEVCNLRDDDCDGTDDEDFKDGNGAYVSQENCGGCGVSCDGKIPDATAFCSGAGPSPRCEVETCNPGFYKAGPLTCLPVVDNTCVPCITDEHCTTPGDRCLQLDGGGFCGTDCSAGNAHGTDAGICPSGFTCRAFPEVGTGVRQCVPTSDSCTCLAGDDGDVRPCSKQNDIATCYGVQMCDPEAGWSACDAKTAAAETCNLADDNCNEVIDDVAGRGDACSITNSAGTCPGNLDCRTGSALTCVGPAPANETCNGKDDDCDGQTDEVAAPLCPLQKGVCAGATQLCAGQSGFLACNLGSYGPKYETKETLCDGLDNDCDGQTDEVDLDGDAHRPIACGGDDCDDKDPLSHPGATEICGDAADNDCNGITDDRDLDGDGFITIACGGDDCNDATALVSPGRLEVCGDNLDNDCDGSVDNKDKDRDTFIDQSCRGGTDCNDDSASAYPGHLEVCGDSLDNDCDGGVDNKDFDHDGFRDTACGGTDCDDTKQLVNPSMPEVCNNQLNDDCLGGVDDKDVDKDGQVDSACVGGTDCDDADPQTKLGSPEVWDAKDNDCGGVIDEGVIPVGAVIVTEVMGDPDVPVTDAAGEYFEVANVAQLPVNLRAWQVASSNDVGFTIAGDLVIAPGQSLVLCRSIDSTTNGGVTCQYEYQAGIQFSNSNADSVTLTKGGGTIDAISFPAAVTGRALILKPGFYDATGNDTAGNWCVLPTLGIYDYDGGSLGPNYGTPGVVNPGNCSATPPPGIAVVVPNNAIGSGGDVVTLFGSGFTQAGTTASICSSVTWFSDNIATCTTWAGVGKVDVTVATGAGTSAALVGGFTYTASGASGGLTSASLTATTSLTVVASAVSPIINASVQPAGVATLAEVGFGPNGSDPSTTPGWRWLPAIKTVAGGAADTFSRSLVIANAGTYRYAFRFSTDGITWLYTSNTGTITVTATP